MRCSACACRDSIVPIDMYVPGCPPHPLTILDGILRLLGRIEDKPKQPLRFARCALVTRSVTATLTENTDVWSRRRFA